MQTWKEVNISPKDQFIELLNRVPLPKKADIILVMRNHNETKTADRLFTAAYLVPKLKCPLIMEYKKNTLEEMEAFQDQEDYANWRYMILVTHNWHMPRVMLTAIKVFNPFRTAVVDNRERLYPYTLLRVRSKSCSSHDSELTRLELEEDRKITEYQEKGDVASYEEGVEYLKWLTSL